MLAVSYLGFYISTLYSSLQGVRLSQLLVLSSIPEGVFQTDLGVGQWLSTFSMWPLQPPLVSVATR